jgi:hypothetical protein
VEVDDAQDEAVKDHGVNHAEDDGEDALEGDGAFEIVPVTEQEGTLDGEGEGGEVQPHGWLPFPRQHPPTDGDPVGDADAEAEQGEGAVGVLSAQEAELLDRPEDAEESGDGDEEPVLLPFESNGENGPEDEGAGEAGGEDTPIAGSRCGIGG